MPLKITDKSSAAGTAITASSTETSLYTKAFAANELSVGKAYLIRGGAIASATTSSDTATFKIRFGTSATVGSNTDCGTSGAVDAVDADISAFDAILTVESATRAVISGWISDVCAATGAKLMYPFCTVLTIAAGTAYRFDYTGKWSTTSASDSMASAHGVVCELV